MIRVKGNENMLTTTTTTKTKTKHMSANEQWQEPTANQSDTTGDGGSPQCGGHGHGCGHHGRGRGGFQVRSTPRFQGREPTLTDHIYDLMSVKSPEHYLIQGFPGQSVQPSYQSVHGNTGGQDKVSCRLCGSQSKWHFAPMNHQVIDLLV